MGNKRILTLGEIMVRFSTPHHLKIEQCHSFDLTYGGAEANVAAALAAFGDQTRFVTALPKNQMGEAALRHLHAHGIDTAGTIRSGERLGIYYLETGSGVRPSVVIYDRKGSSFSETSPAEYDLETCFDGVEWFHISGITPALTPATLKLTETFLHYAKEIKKIPVSLDLNYRKKLWDQKRATEVMISLMKYVDLIAGNEEDAICTLGLAPPDPAATPHDRFFTLSKQIYEKFNPRLVLTSLRESLSADENILSGMLYDGKEFIASQHYTVTNIVDRVGSGDAFLAGFLHSYFVRSHSKEDALAFATASFALKHTIWGDFMPCNETDVEALVNGNRSGRIQR